MNLVQRTLRRVDGFQQRHLIASFMVGVIKKYGDDNAGNLVVQITYALFLTVFPLLLLLVTVLGIVLADDPADRARVLHTAVGQFPIIGQQLAHNIHAIKRSSVFGLATGVLGLIYGSTGLARTGLFSMAQIWDIPATARPGYFVQMARALIFLAVLAVGLIVTTALAGLGTFGKHVLWLGILAEALAAVVNVALYIAAFRTLTPHQVKTRALLPGAVTGGIAWTILQAMGGYVVGHDLKGASALYGLFGLVLGLMAWIYLGAQVTLYSAEINPVLCYKLWPRGLVAPPLTEADQRSLALQVLERQQRPEQDISTRFRGKPMTQDEYRARGYELDDDSERQSH